MRWKKDFETSVMHTTLIWCDHWKEDQRANVLVLGRTDRTPMSGDLSDIRTISSIFSYTLVFVKLFHVTGSCNKDLTANGLKHDLVCVCVLWRAHAFSCE